MKAFNGVREYKEVLAWIERAKSENALEKDQEDLFEYLNAQRNLSNTRRSGTCLMFMATHWAKYFLECLWQGDDAQKWGTLYVDYILGRLRIQVENYDIKTVRGEKLRKVEMYYNVYPYYCFLLTFGRWREAAWLGERLYRSREDGCFGEWMMDREFAGLVLKLHLVVEGKCAPLDEVEGLPELGVYAGLFEHWEDEGELAEVIGTCCDEYYLRTQESMEKKLGIVEFYSSPYRALPVSILALRSVRRRMGLETIFPEHAMLDSRFVRNLPEELPSVKDDLLERVMDAASEVLPGIREL